MGEYDGPERRNPDDIYRRLSNLEKVLDNGRFLRKDVFDIVIHDVRDDYTRIATELGEIKATMKAEREVRETDRKSLRNLIIAALLSAAGSIIVSILVAAANRP